LDKQSLKFFKTISLFTFLLFVSWTVLGIRTVKDLVDESRETKRELFNEIAQANSNFKKIQGSATHTLNNIDELVNFINEHGNEVKDGSLVIWSYQENPACLHRG